MKLMDEMSPEDVRRLARDVDWFIDPETGRTVFIPCTLEAKAALEQMWVDGDVVRTCGGYALNNQRFIAD